MTEETDAPESGPWEKLGMSQVLKNRGSEGLGFSFRLRVLASDPPRRSKEPETDWQAALKSIVRTQRRDPLFALTTSLRCLLGYRWFRA
jgi:hypothetical protein